MTPTPDRRSPLRQAQDEQIASEPQLAPLTLSANATPLPVEVHLDSKPRPLPENPPLRGRPE
jgi:hypothetical protein